MGSIRMGPPPELVLFLARESGAGRFVETGTFRGATARWAAGHFAAAVTIEASEELFRAAKTNLADLANLAVVHGESGRVLREQVPAWREPVLFWLDAHWSGGPTFGVESECPLLAELAAIDASPVDHVILVDDARCFVSPPPRPHRASEWPGLTQVTAALAANGRRFVALWDDCFVAVPTRLQARTSDWLQDRATEAQRQAGSPSWRERLRLVRRAVFSR